MANDIDSLLDATLDDLADVPEFKPYPIGAHRAVIKWDYTKKVNEKVCVELSIQGIETVELTNPEDTPITPGMTTSMLFNFTKKDGTKNEIAEGQWKELLKPLAAHFGTANNRATMDASNGAECLAVTTIRADKKDPNDVKYYTAIKSLTVL